VASKHKEAQTFLRKRFFEGLKSFRDFEARTEKLANTKEVGDALEILVEAHLHLDPVLKAKNVWVVGDIPLNIRKSLNLPADSKGIDGVYEDASGNIIPYQVKYRTDKETLPYGEVSSFLGITEESLKDRVIFTNARNLAADITKRKGLRSFKSAQFHSLTEEDFNRIHAWLSDKKPTFKRWSPQPHQKEAIEKITAALKETDRTTAVMACGTGKTLVALWAAEAQKPKTVLVLVPSLALLSQTLPDWCKQTSWGERFRYLCVCSDASVDRSAKEDEYALKQSDLEFSVTTDAKVVKDFVSDNQSGVNVIFSTYQSAEVVAKGTKGKTIDLGIFDEAHKTTGPKEGLFAFGLNDKNLRIKKRLFLTATPRHYKLNKRDKDGDFQVVSMNDEAVYGKVSYRLPFSTAVAAGIIVPYKVIISVSLNKEVDAELLRRGSTRVRRDEIQAKWVANQIALKRAIEKTGASKIITFHSRVNLAEDFAGDDARGFKEHVKGLDVFHVNGSQNAADRKALLEGFKSAPKGLITNARCLTEGVDVPAVDMVAFVDPRKSKIDIAQAAGRAMRQSKATSKKLGYIVVPLFIEQKKGETEAEAFTRAGFDEVAEVLAAMLESDDDLVDTIEKMQEARGRGDKFNPRKLHEKIEVIGPAINLDKLTQSIDVKILESLGVSWDRWFGLLQKYHNLEGHCRVPSSHVINGLKIGAWVRQQRSLFGQLSNDRVARLNSLGFSWSLFDEQWDSNFQTLLKFREREGHTRVPQTHIENRLHLGAWASNQRNLKDQLSPERLKLLNEISFCWDIDGEVWELHYSLLVNFHKREGHSNVPQRHKEMGLSLGTWVNNLRHKKSHITQERLQRLNSLNFPWDPHENRWESNFQALLKFRKREGHTLVPKGHTEAGVRLSSWVVTQRAQRNEMQPDRKKRLGEIGFSWDPHGEHWESNFTALVKFQNREGHTRIPSSHVENGLKLGIWATNTRKKFKELSSEQIKRLHSVGFSTKPRDEIWDQYFRAVRKFRQREGHFRIKRNHTEDGLKIGSWMQNQRSLKDKLSTDRLKKLNSIGFTWDVMLEQWEYAYHELKIFRKREGHCHVPTSYEQGGIKLGRWASTQRIELNQLSRERISRLNSLGFVWDTLAKQWDDSYNALKDFVRRNGHTRVPAATKVGGLSLGKWVSRQRLKKAQLTPDRLKRLNALRFEWK
jgi:superfamily II DNA or RNA helicase